MEADAVSYNMLFSACSKCFDLSFEAPKFMLLDHIFGGVYHPIYIQYTFNIHSIYIGTIIIFFTESRWVLRLS